MDRPASNPHLARANTVPTSWSISCSATTSYVALNPDSTFRALHDSIVNYGGNKPEIVLAQRGPAGRRVSATRPGQNEPGHPDAGGPRDPGSAGGVAADSSAAGDHGGVPGAAQAVIPSPGGARRGHRC